MKFRKFAAVLAAASMTAAMSAQMAFAADAVTISAENVTAAAGSEFTLKVDLSGVPAAGVSAADFALTYDASVITITGVSAGDITNTTAIDSMENFDGVSVFGADFSVAGTINITYGIATDDTAYWVTKDGTFLTVTGTVNADAAAGASTAIEFAGIKRETSSENKEVNTNIYIGNMNADAVITNYEVTTSAGSVTVEGGEVTPGTVKKGDVNEDGEIDIRDVIMLNRSIFGKITLTDTQKKNADVNEDGLPDASDSLEILKCVVKLITFD